MKETAQGGVQLTQSLGTARRAERHGKPRSCCDLAEASALEILHWQPPIPGKQRIILLLALR